jgi:hypothetical protein
MGTSTSKRYTVTADDFVVEIVSAKNVPKADLTSEVCAARTEETCEALNGGGARFSVQSDPFARLSLRDAHGKQRGVTVSTLYRADTANPVWHAFRCARRACGRCTLTAPS